MVLDEITDGASRLRTGFDNEGTRRLVFILCLPLVDGVFATLLVTGAIGTFSDVVAVALTVFTGAGALAVLYTYAETAEEARKMVLKASAALILGAAAVGLVAPFYSELFHLERLRYAAGIALAVIAAQLADIKVAESFSVPAVMLTGMALSVKNPGALEFTLVYLQPALLTSLVASLGLYAAASVSNSRMNLVYIRRGGALVLMILALSQLGVKLPSELGLAVFATALAASFVG